ncbi:DUF3810 domain-containing protein [Prolixibacter sp. SD074]|uniref:DUF3810 domain-containing protein n=1 Tax=Prolixibacter sp. SD074 TaxID=2652391 RepID=UPI0012790A35|nr:DUF3810 domain-containing protein [Prolixibacter sp. SD074]GET30955.1 hypothetical protein SD074_31570 [Prolixibacter sp. SD074]
MGYWRKVRGFLFSTRYLPFWVAAVVFLITRLAIRFPQRTDEWYSHGAYPVIATILSFFSQFIPFSLWDVFWTGFVFAAIIVILLLIIRKIRFTPTLLKTLQFLAILYSYFYLVWGFNYFRPSIDNRLHFTEAKLPDSLFVETLDNLIAQTNASWMEMDSMKKKNVNRAVEASYKANSAFLQIDCPNGYRRPKTMLYSGLFAKSGVSGYFGPFFNEIQINGKLLPTEYPFVLAHEKAHQFGMARESEANFCAYVVCSTSENPYLRYSANFNLIQYFLVDALPLKNYRDYVKKLRPEVIADIRAEQKYWRAMRNEKLDRIQTAANDAYLKSNNIKQGTFNYNQVVDLILRWYAQKEKR